MGDTQRKTENETKTIFYMIEDFCGEKHGSKNELCSDCQELLDYAFKRIEKCPHGENKPNCGDCKIHCYKPDMRKKVIDVMRFSGPRMAFKHPVLAARHMMNAMKHKQSN